jgi:tetratricopeptide (TPR) repeat protein
VLEQKIRELRLTFEEFTAYVETFRREHNESGTLGQRHLERLVAGHRGDGQPLGQLRPATARLLEHIFGLSIDELLAPPTDDTDDDTATELRQRLNASRHIDNGVINLFREQLDNFRRLDRQLGAIVAYDEVVTKARQVEALQSHSLTPSTRTNLAALLAELSALAGWQALDQNRPRTAWDHHEHAKTAAREADSPALLAHALAQQAVILIDLGETHTAVDQLAQACDLAQPSTPRLLQSWLAAAHGEGLAAAGCRDDSLHAFDAAGALLPSDPVDSELPFLFLGGPHLDRWRGHAFTRLGKPEAVDVLTDALHRLDRTFTRAATVLRVDLAAAYTAAGEHNEAQIHMQRASSLATEIGSARQQRRIQSLSTSWANRE